MGTSDECILVVPRAVVDKLPVTAGFVADLDVVRQVLDAVAAERTFLPRQEAELDPGHVQPIALTYIKHQGCVLVLPMHRRTADKLSGKYALWVGGHVREADAESEKGAIGEGIRRELAEELMLPEAALSTPELVGLALDEGSPRARMHLGVVHRADLLDPVSAVVRPSPGSDRRAAIRPSGVRAAGALVPSHRAPAAGGRPGSGMPMRMAGQPAHAGRQRA